MDIRTRHRLVLHRPRGLSQSSLLDQRNQPLASHDLDLRFRTHSLSLFQAFQT
jgi:hypothetical protein